MNLNEFRLLAAAAATTTVEHDAAIRSREQSLSLPFSAQWGWGSEDVMKYYIGVWLLFTDFFKTRGLPHLYRDYAAYLVWHTRKVPAHLAPVSVGTFSTALLQDSRGMLCYYDDRLISIVKDGLIPQGGPDEPIEDMAREEACRSGALRERMSGIRSDGNTTVAMAEDYDGLDERGPLPEDCERVARMQASHRAGSTLAWDPEQACSACIKAEECDLFLDWAGGYHSDHEAIDSLFEHRRETGGFHGAPLSW